MEGGDLDSSGQEPLVPDIQFILEDQFQELLRTQPVGRGLLDPDLWCRPTESAPLRPSENVPPLGGLERRLLAV